MDNVIGSIVEALHNFILLRGDDYDTLPNHMEASDQRYSTLGETGFRFITDGAHDGHVADFSVGTNSTQMCMYNYSLGKCSN